MRAICAKEDETHCELAVRVQDPTRKWMKECKKVEDVVKLITTEQLLEALPMVMQIWVRERKPKKWKKVGNLQTTTFRHGSRRVSRIRK